MAGKVDKSQTYFVRSVNAEAWELWTFPDTKRAQFIRSLDKPADSPGNTVVALPAQRTISLLTWLGTNDKTVIPEMLQLQLEQRGLLGRGATQRAMDFRVVESDENRSLTLATVLQPDFPQELTFDRAVRFEPSVFTMPLPQDRIVVWRESGRLAVAATRGRDPVHFQILNDKKLSEGAVHELKCIALELESEAVMNPFLGVVLWGDFTTEELERVQKALGIKAFRDDVPPPNLPPMASKLLPAQVETLHIKRRRRIRIQKIVAIAVAIYAVFLLSQILFLGWQRFQASQLQHRIAEETPMVETIQETAEKWHKLQWAVDPKVYPVELLLQAANLLPDQGMRLTSFEIEKGKVVMHGESSGAPAAFKFAEDVKSAPSMQMFQWQMPSPSLRPDGRAEFIIEGEPKFAKIK